MKILITITLILFTGYTTLMTDKGFQYGFTYFKPIINNDKLINEINIDFNK